MREMRFVFGVVASLVPGLLASGCGGSSSETPPPLEPDLRRFESRTGPTQEDIDSANAERMKARRRQAPR